MDPRRLSLAAPFCMAGAEQDPLRLLEPPVDTSLNINISSTPYISTFILGLTQSQYCPRMSDLVRDILKEKEKLAGGWSAVVTMQIE